MKEKVVNSIKNFEKALGKLQEYTDEPMVTDRDRAGVIKAFEFTFELAWKTFQKIAKYEGLESGGPRTSVKQAFALDLIENDSEQVWLHMLEDRNLMSHTYREAMSREVSEKIKNLYRETFQTLLKRFKDKYE